MAIGAYIAQPQPAAIVTTSVGTEMHRGIHHPGASVRWGQRVRPLRRRWSRLIGLLVTQRTVRLVRQAHKGFGLVGTSALRLDGWGWGLGNSTGWARPKVRHHEAQPEQDQNDQLIVDVVRNHQRAPFDDCVGGPFYLLFKPSELSAAVGYTTNPRRAEARPGRGAPAHRPWPR